MFLNAIAVFIGGGIGAVLRFLTSLAYLRFYNFNLPLATLTVNLIGSFLLGLLVAYFEGANDIPENIKCAMTIGLCGGFTTFSTFAFEVFDIFKRGEYFIGILYTILSVFLCVLVAAAGYYWAKNYVYY